MWPFSTIQKLRDENASLTRRLQELETLIAKNEKDIYSLRNEQKTAQEKLIVIEKDRDELKKHFDFMKNVEVTPEFLEVEKSIKNRDPLIFVHGGAGTGKSTLVQWLKAKGLIHVVLAPTGLAALNVGGMTIHRAFQFPGFPVFTKDGTDPILPQNFKSVLDNLKANNIETICIDEISMVRSDLLDAINVSLNNTYGGNLFGGFQFIFVGDLYQLPPVVNQAVAHFFDPKDENYPGDLHGWRSPWFLDSDVLTLYRSKMKRIDLTRVFRQSGEKDFVHTLNNLRNYSNIPESAKALNGLIPVKDAGEHNCVIIVGTNAQADCENNKRLQMLATDSSRYAAMKTGTFLDYTQKNLPVPDDITLKVGEFVMFVANDSDKRFFNGTTGEITHFGVKGEVYVKIEGRHDDVPVQQYEWIDYDVVWDPGLKRFVNNEVGRYSQIPLIPAYAITCHKSQGKTIDKVFIDIQRAFSSGQMYVALSRTRSLHDITMKRPLIYGDFPCNPALLRFKQQGLI